MSRMKYFWLQYEELPEGLGYGRFSPQHWATLAGCALLIAVLLFLFRRMPEERKNLWMRVIPWVMAALECFKDLFLIQAGRFGAGYLPLHLCSLGLFVFLLYAHSKTARWKGVFGEIAVTLILPGSIAALLFPDWAHLYPVFNFMNLYGYVWHSLLVIYPLLCLSQKQVRLSIRHIHYDFLFLLCTVPPVYLFDRIFHCNYMFVNWPPKGTPLEWIASVTGDAVYLAGYAVFSVFVIVLIYAAIGCVHLIKDARGAGRG